MHKTIIIKLGILMLAYSLEANAQRFPPNDALKEELKYRKGKPYKEEKYYNKGKLDSIYHKWNAHGQILTKGYYVNGKQHGQWWEWLSKYQSCDFMTSTYEQGILKKVYHYIGWIKKQDTIKSREYFYTLEPDTSNFTVHRILWDTKLNGGKISEDETLVIRDNMIFSKKIKRWDKGIPWEWEHTKTLYDKNGKSLGHRKHGHWKLWNEDGTLQKETWYHMGKKLREKRYEKGKLVVDKKY